MWGQGTAVSEVSEFHQCLWAQSSEGPSLLGGSTQSSKFPATGFTPQALTRKQTPLGPQQINRHTAP